MSEHVDVLIVGAGLSGIGMACHLQKECAGKSYVILERRNAVGGTWDMFDFPGIRSDSDMFSYAYAFRPWTSPKVLVQGKLLREYVDQTAQEFGVDRHIRFGLKTEKAAWSSDLKVWTISALEESTGKQMTYTCSYLVSCTGYYDHDKAYVPEFPGFEVFKGQSIHPQFWPENLDYKGKKVVIIGSGATAITLVPAMVAEAAHVTMLQRTPSYYFNYPDLEKLEKTIGVFKKALPARWVSAVLRVTYIALQRSLYKSSRRWPKMMRKFFLRPIRKKLGDDVDMRHFTPTYKPWDQRLCIVPGGDLFDAFKSEKASVVTDEIASFTEDGILLKSGSVLDADIVVTATGFRLKTLGGIKFIVDGRTLVANRLLSYRAVLMQDLPNMAYIFGYTNASWTLKSDIASRYVCRLIKFMDSKGFVSATPRAPAGEAGRDNIMSTLSSRFVQRESNELPRQGRSGPWHVTNSYEIDKRRLLREEIDDGRLEFTPTERAASSSKPQVAEMV